MHTICSCLSVQVQYFLLSYWSSWRTLSWLSLHKVAPLFYILREVSPLFLLLLTKETGEVCSRSLRAGSSPVPSSLWVQNNSQINTNHSISTRAFALMISFKNWVPVLTKQGELTHLDRKSFSCVNSHIWENKRNYFQVQERSATKTWNNSVKSGMGVCDSRYS